MNSIFANRIYTIWIFLTIGLSGCLLQEGDIKAIVVEEVFDPSLTEEIQATYGREIFSLRSDTIWLGSNERITLRLSGPFVRSFEMYLDGIAQSPHDDFEFLLEGDAFESGFYELRFIQVVKSGTGTLADVVGSEFATYEFSAKLAVGEDAVATPQIDQVVFEDGRAKVEWDRYHRGDFQYYQLGSSITSFIDSVQNPNENFLFDPTYIGKPVVYQLITSNGNWLISEEFSFSDSYLPNLRLTDNGGSTTMLTWDQPPFYRNLSSIRLEGQSLSPETTAIDLNEQFRFGDTQDVRMELIGFSAFQDPVVYRQPVDFGKRTFSFQDVLYAEQSELYYVAETNRTGAQQPGGVYVMDRNLDPVNSTSFEFRFFYQLLMSPNGERLFAFDRTTLYELDLSTLSFEFVGSFEHGMYIWRNNPRDLSVSNNGLITYYRNDPQGFSVFEVIDILDFSIVFAQEDYVGTSQISPNGELMVLEDGIYHWNGTTFEFVRSLGIETIRFVHFRTDTQLILSTSEVTYLYDLNTSTITQQFDFMIPEYFGAIEYNPTLNEVIAIGRDTSVDFSQLIDYLNLATGEVTREVLGESSNFLRREGEYVFNSDGFAINAEQ